MRVGVTVIGGLMALAGAVWIGQGLGYIKGSFMTGDVHWFWIGSATLAIGVVLALVALLRPARGAQPPG
ncbi:MAG TPA: hypothetical protein VHO95_10060 [Candidatus Dormibacteraeota bacterium]|nr:hypothetical protein [Candidatus Dormibacteraeota bacterium]